MGQAMGVLAGWVFSIDDGSQARRFLVAEPQLRRAKTLVSRQVPTAQFLNWQRLPDRLFAFLDMRRGDINEWPASAEVLSGK
jgi:hypothetical protein